MGDKQALAAVNRLCIIAGRRSVGWGDRDDLLNAADTIDRLTRERDEAYTAGFEAAREEAAKVCNDAAAHICTTYPGDVTAAVGGAMATDLEDLICSLSPPEQGHPPGDRP